MGIFDRLKEGLTKTRNSIAEKFDMVLSLSRNIDEELYEELEEVMIMSDMGVSTTNKIIKMLRGKVKDNKINDSEGVRTALKDIISEIMGSEKKTVIPEKTPAIYMIVGVNGVGKTTSIGKIGYYLKSKGYKVMLAAGDTFRAAAIDQLEIWGGKMRNRCYKAEFGC